MKVLVTGATGYIGGRLVPQLLAAGHTVRCLVRDPSRLAGRTWDDVDIVRADVLQPETLPGAFEGMGAAYYLIHSMAEGKHGFEDRDRNAARNAATAARAAGLEQLIYLGGLGSGDAHLSPHLASRQEVGDILRASGVPVTEFRAAIVVGSGSMSFEMIRHLTERLPIMITPRWVSTPCQPIAIENVLEYLVESLGYPAAIGELFEIGGPDVLTYAEMMKGYAAVRGLKRVLIPVPVLTPTLSSYWVDLITPIPAAYSHPLIEGLRSEVVVRDARAQDIFDLRLISYRDAVERAFSDTLSGKVETSWCGALADLEPGVSLSATEGRIVERRTLPASVPPAELFHAFMAIGGEHGWLYADWAWHLRGLLDRLVGGVGMRRGRRNPDLLRAGDALDFWRVEALEDDRLLRLRAEMKLPGLAWLQFESVPQPDGESMLVQSAFFEPKGLAGLLYWYALYPMHALIFSGMARNLVRHATQKHGKTLNSPEKDS